MIDLNLLYEQIQDAKQRMSKTGDITQFVELIETQPTFWVDGIKCCIWNDVITSIAGIPPDYLPGACFIPDANCIVLNEFCAYKAPRAVLEAIIQHELGHRQYAHYSGERNIEHEYQADRYSFNKGCDIVGALQYMVDIANNDLQHVAFTEMVEELEDRINVLKALDK
jgi:hypothetical protein